MVPEEAPAPGRSTCRHRVERGTTCEPKEEGESGCTQRRPLRSRPVAPLPDGASPRVDSRSFFDDRSGGPEMDEAAARRGSVWFIGLTVIALVLYVLLGVLVVTDEGVSATEAVHLVGAVALHRDRVRRPGHAQCRG